MPQRRQFLLCFQAAVNVTSSAFRTKLTQVFLSAQVLQFLTFSINGLFLCIFPYLLQKDLAELFWLYKDMLKFMQNIFCYQRNYNDNNFSLGFNRDTVCIHCPAAIPSLLTMDTSYKQWRLFSWCWSSQRSGFLPQTFQQLLRLYFMNFV